MTKVLISGSSGFVGSNLINYFNLNTNYIINQIKIRNHSFQHLNSDIYIHLAGIAHDRKNLYSLDDYIFSNFSLTKIFFDEFLNDNSATCFIFMSSVKAAADKMKNLNILTELDYDDIKSFYGISKRKAENYLLNTNHVGKRVYILRPCMIHGLGNKGNLNLLYSLVSKGFPWPLGLFQNNRSYLSIENLCFIIKELIEREDVPSGVYNVADDVPLSTNELIRLIAESKQKRAKILNLSKNLINALARIGDFLKLPLNSERLQKLTESYIVSNAKIKKALGKQFPLSSKDGLFRTFQSFSDNG
uniref:NAD-dependent epimerase/dehydratase family protein n=1 Tax=Algoriphagus sp. TaxID=1872435 RepID=UPI0040475132